LYASFARWYNGGYNSAGWILVVFFISFIVFNFVVRKIVWFKPYFTSKYNFFSTKFRTQNEYDIPKDLMFKKVIEVLDSSKFKIHWSDTDKFEIFAMSGPSFWSWGENIYIDFKEEDGKTLMNFCSVAVFQLYTWGKNEDNYEDLINNIEESLII